MKKHPQPGEFPKGVWADPVEQIVPGDHDHSQRGDPAYGKAHDRCHRHHRPSEYPDHARTTKWHKESPAKPNEGEFEKHQPKTARPEKSGNFLHRFSSRNCKKRAGS